MEPMSLEDKINHDYVVGAVRYLNEFSFYFMPPIYWSTDSDYYDPEYKNGSVSDPTFRNGVGKLYTNNTLAYFQAVEEDKINIQWIKENLKNYPEELQPVFFVDIDNYKFVSCFAELNYEDHVAPGWEGILDYPVNYLPDEIKQIWE